MCHQKHYLQIGSPKKKFNKPIAIYYDVDEKGK
jgi:hypothetical protein